MTVKEIIEKLQGFPETLEVAGYDCKTNLSRLFAVYEDSCGIKDGKFSDIDADTPVQRFLIFDFDMEDKTENRQTGATKDKAKQNGDYTAYPTTDEHNWIGLTKRELMAAMALQGLAANPQYRTQSSTHLATFAVDMADILLQELAK